MTMPLAFADYVPVVLFLISMILLQQDLYNKMSKGAFALFACGGIMVFIAGFFKATWKLLYAARICDFTALSSCFFPLQSTGFLLCAIGLIAMLCFPQGHGDKLLSVVAVPSVFSGTMIFVSLMCLGLIGMVSVLSVIAWKMKKRCVVVLFLFAGVGMLGMGYLSSKDFSSASMHWIAEGLNSASQLVLLCAVISLRKAGLRSFSLRNS